MRGWTWLCLLAAVVVAFASVRASATDEASVVSAAEASVAAALAADAAAAAADAKAGAASSAEAGAEAGAEAERKKNGKDGKKGKGKKKNHKKKKHRYVGGDIMFNRAMKVRGVMAAGSVVANNATIQGTLITRQLKAKRLRAHTMSVGELKTTRLSSPTGTIIIDGDLLITHSPKHKKDKKGKGKGKGKHGKAAAKAARGMSFLAEEVVVAGTKQWALIRHDHFEANEIEGWHLVETNEAVTSTNVCTGSSSDHFLGGHCQLANGPVRKVFTHLPPHTRVRVTARYHFIDNWRGETAFASIDGAYVWTQSHRISSEAAGVSGGLQLCGSAEYPESRLSSPIDVSIAHSGSSVSIAFGAHSTASATGAIRSLADEHANACVRSFGIDDVSIYIR